MLGLGKNYTFLECAARVIILFPLNVSLRSTHRKWGRVFVEGLTAKFPRNSLFSVNGTSRM